MKLYGAVFITLIVCLTLPVSSNADQLEDANAAIKNENYQKASELLLPLAEENNKEAQRLLGSLYVNGKGVEKDFNKGMALIMKAARQGLMAARIQAFGLYLGLAKQGDTGAMYNVGVMCLNGWGGGKYDTDTCLKFMENAGKMGHEKSTKMLARIYKEGMFGVTPDEKKTSYWNSLHAAFTSGIDAQQEMYQELQKHCQDAQEAYESKDYVKAINILEQVLEKPLNAANWMLEYNLACTYAQSGKKEKALYHLEKAVSLGFVNVEYLRKDKNMISVHESPGYSAIIKKAAEMEETQKKAVANVPEPEDILLKAKGVEQGQKTPLLIFLHGRGGLPKEYKAALKPLVTDWQYTLFLPCGSVKLGMRRDGKPAYTWDPKKAPGKIIKKINALKNIQTDQVYLAGLSAGGYISYEIGIEFPDVLKGVIVFSGGLNRGMLFDKNVNEASGKIPFYIVHGTQDTTVPIFFGYDAQEYLKNKGFRVVLKKFYGGHSLPSDYINIIKKAIKWFQKNP